MSTKTDPILDDCATVEDLRDPRKPLRQSRYGVDPACPNDVDPFAMIRARDHRRGFYVRESIDLQTGQIKRDDNGKVLYDESRLPISGHLTWASRGWRLRGLEVEAAS